MSTNPCSNLGWLEQPVELRTSKETELQEPCGPLELARAHVFCSAKVSDPWASPMFNRASSAGEGGNWENRPSYSALRHPTGCPPDRGHRSNLHGREGPAFLAGRKTGPKRTSKEQNNAFLHETTRVLSEGGGPFPSLRHILKAMGLEKQKRLAPSRL